MTMSTIMFQLTIPIRDEWDNIELLRTSLLNCLTTIFRDTNFCHEVGIIAGELLENALKYGDWTHADDTSFQLAVHGDADSVSVEVTNPVASEDAARDVMRMASWIEGFESAQAAYLTRLKEVAEQDPSDETSRLGLVRIAYQSNCRLQAELQPNHLLTVRAVCRAPDSYLKTGTG